MMYVAILSPWIKVWAVRLLVLLVVFVSTKILVRHSSRRNWFIVLDMW